MGPELACVGMLGFELDSCSDGCMAVQVVCCCFFWFITVAEVIVVLLVAFQLLHAMAAVPLKRTDVSV